MIQNPTKASLRILAQVCTAAPAGKQTPRSLDTGDPTRRVAHTDRRTGQVSATLAFTCTLTCIQRGVGGRNRNHNFGDTERVVNTYTRNMTFTLQISCYPLYDGEEGAHTHTHRLKESYAVLEQQ